jgi:hydrogenase nickel incorporation protein HypB
MKTNLATRFEQNAEIARANRAAFALDGVTAVSLVGPAGAGKTTVIEAIARKLRESMRIGAVIGNPASAREAERLLRQGVRAVPVQTDNLTATDVARSIAELGLARTDLVFIESAGNNLSPVEFDFGQDFRIGVFSVAGGDDKAAECAGLVAECDLVLLGKIDLMPFVDFDLDLFKNDLEKIRPGIGLVQFSSRSGAGVEAFVNWLGQRWSPDKQFRAIRPKQHMEWLCG